MASLRNFSDISLLIPVGYIRLSSLSSFAMARLKLSRLREILLQTATIDHAEMRSKHQN